MKDSELTHTGEAYLQALERLDLTGRVDVLEDFSDRHQALWQNMINNPGFTSFDRRELFRTVGNVAGHLRTAWFEERIKEGQIHLLYGEDRRKSLQEDLQMFLEEALRKDLNPAR